MKTDEEGKVGFMTKVKTALVGIDRAVRRLSFNRLSAIIVIIAVVLFVLFAARPDQVTRGSIRYAAGTSGFYRWAADTVHTTRHWRIQNYGIMAVAKSGNTILVGYGKKWSATDAREVSPTWLICSVVDRIMFRENPWTLQQSTKKKVVAEKAG